MSERGKGLALVVGNILAVVAVIVLFVHSGLLSAVLLFVATVLSFAVIVSRMAESGPPRQGTHVKHGTPNVLGRILSRVRLG